MSLKENISSYLKKKSFQPDLISSLYNPFYFIRRELYLHLKKLAPKLTGNLLDFGCGRKPYENLFTVSEYIGIDMEQTGHEHKSSKVDVFYDGKNIPFSNETFDCVFCSEVFEHVFNLDEIVAEINRVLKKNGSLLITVPFCWNEHEVPYDFGRYTSFGIKHILVKSGFEIIEYHKSGNFARVNWQLWALYFFSLFKTKRPLLNYVGAMLFVLPINVLGILLLPLFPRNKSLYFNNIVLARKI